MSQDETDWKTLRRLHPIALERFCQKILAEIDDIRRDTGKTGHERYLAIYELLQRRDEEIGDAFNDMRRSRALHRVLNIYELGVLTDDEFAQFSEPMRKSVLDWLNMQRSR